MDCLGQVILPNGYWIDRTHYRNVKLRVLTGLDEEFFAEQISTTFPANRITNLLNRCITSMDGVEEVTSDAVGRLTVGDREALLLHLRRLIMGERMQCILNCPQTDCNELMDIELRVSDLLQPTYQKPEPVYEDIVESAGRKFRVRFSLPTGIDQEAAALKASTDVQAGGVLLLRRCVESVFDDEDIETEWFPEILPEMLKALPIKMARLDPQAELILNLTCPICEESFSTCLIREHIYYRKLRQHQTIFTLRSICLHSIITGAKQIF
ncbi:MAG: hypothetical protein SCABRO_00853 [Candidatus Scalindua brodae]|uniref:T4 bacteriophage base plate protein n=1 Tax=Candidatus Scalindua brodae TaxID=237368 RepID=A0A0B0EK57_9BACT|nr:MAG: hypothetical protein SCABRO_00853 [Candidatus Scalindua brodae]